MDDLHKETFSIWKLRLKLENMKKKMRRIEALINTEEFSQKFSKEEQKQIKKEMQLLGRDCSTLEKAQSELEEKINLPNPYLKRSE